MRVVWSLMAPMMRAHMARARASGREDIGRRTLDAGRGSGRKGVCRDEQRAASVARSHREVVTLTGRERHCWDVGDISILPRHDAGQLYRVVFLECCIWYLGALWGLWCVAQHTACEGAVWVAALGPV